MIRPIIGTIGTRVTVTAMNLLLVMATGRALGIAGLGAISLIVLGITFILLLSNVIGGGALVYLAPRFAARRLLVPSYSWAVISAGIAFLVLHFIDLVPEGTAPHVVALAFLQALNAIHLNMLLGRQRIATHNGLLIAQGGILLLAFFLLLRLDGASVQDYIGAAYGAHGLTVLASGTLLALRPSAILDGGGSAWAALLRQGGLVQTANVMQLLNYRFTFYLLEKLHGLATLGLFSVAVQLAESAWLAPKSLGTVLYYKVSNSTDPERQRDLTLTILKASLVFTVAVVLVLLLVPGNVFQWLFGAEVVGMAPIIAVMVPGLLAMSASQAFSHYFSGTGRNTHNVVGSGIALACTLIAAPFLVKHHGLIGAAAMATIAYSANGIYQATVFARFTGSGFRQFLPGTADLTRLKRVWREL